VDDEGNYAAPSPGVETFSVLPDDRIEHSGLAKFFLHKGYFKNRAIPRIFFYCGLSNDPFLAQLIQVRPLLSTNQVRKDCGACAWNVQINGSLSLHSSTTNFCQTYGSPKNIVQLTDLTEIGYLSPLPLCLVYICSLISTLIRRSPLG
jgi:hypothetical protein